MSDLTDFFNEGELDGIYDKVLCQKALSPSKLPDMDYALNPYSGCSHGCVYCYAPEVTHKEWSGWRKVKVKINIAERLAKELKVVDGIIGIGTVTDPYQPAEKKFELTRGCLGIIQRNGKKIHLHTKSDLIIRDMDILGMMDAKIAITITGIDESKSKILEPGAPLPQRRLDALKQLSEVGMNTYALIGPVLSTLEGREEEFCDAVVDTGVKVAYLDHLNSRPLLSERLARKNVSGSDDALRMIREGLVRRGLTVNDVFSNRKY